MNIAGHVAEFLRRHRLEGAIGVVAVSGGPDSVALAHLLLTSWRTGKIERLILAHVNHQLRGDESDADETFVQQLPESWWEPRLTVRTQRIDVATLATGDNLESVGRRERYRWLTEIAVQEKAAWIATGHSADDQAETVLFRLLRGSGMQGLGAMPERRPLDLGVALIRPLLGVRRQAIVDYVAEQQLACRIDSSNRDLRFTRNRLRLELLPLLESQYNPAVVDVLCRLADQARELHADVADAAAKLLHDAELSRAGNILVFAIERLRDQPANLVREMFRLVWEREGWSKSAMDFERWHWLVGVVAGTHPGGDFPGPIQVRRVGRVLQIEPKAVQPS